MSRVKGRGNAATELRLINIMRRYRICGWRRNSTIAGRPDFVFLKKRVALFVDGCFWHGCRLHGAIPKSNSEFWARKINENIRRDRKVDRELKALGWRVLRVWQHDLRESNAKNIAAKIEHFLQR